MARYKYSLDRKDAKFAGVCSMAGAMTGIDPTFIRIGFVAAAVMISLQYTLLVYVLAGIGLAVARNKHLAQRTRQSDFDRMGDVASRRPTVHAMRTEFDANDRRLMAIDHHLSTQNDDLAREIESLRAKQVQEDK